MNGKKHGKKRLVRHCLMALLVGVVGTATLLSMPIGSAYYTETLGASGILRSAELDPRLSVKPTANPTAPNQARPGVIAATAVVDAERSALAPTAQPTPDLASPTITAIAPTAKPGNHDGGLTIKPTPRATSPATPSATPGATSTPLPTAVPLALAGDSPDPEQSAIPTEE